MSVFEVFFSLSKFIAICVGARSRHLGDLSDDVKEMAKTISFILKYPDVGRRLNAQIVSKPFLLLFRSAVKTDTQK